LDGTRRVAVPSVGPGGPAAFLAIVGPTASGKTALSLAIAKRIPGEIISMDSRQIYKGMDVGTGKVTEEEKGAVPHHGLDLRTPDETYSAGQFSRDAREWMRGIRSRGRVPLLVGGTGFFLRALTNPMFSQPPLDADRLENLRTFLNSLTEEDLGRYLAVLDPERKPQADVGGRQRSTRAIEMALLTGRPLSWWHQEGPPSEAPLRGVILVLDMPRDLLYERINRRVEEMFVGGLVDEVRGLVGKGYSASSPGMTGAGYRETLAFLSGDLTRDQAIEETRRSHRRYARRQVTWFRHQLPPDAVWLDGTLPGDRLADSALEAWEALAAGELAHNEPIRADSFRMRDAHQ
jgi:tRNA dimethylallyltransferase